MLSLSGFPPGTIYSITGITQAVPGVVTLATVADAYSFAVANGQTVTISKVRGMYQVNDQRYVIASLDPIAKTFQLYTIEGFPADTSAYTTYIDSGEINIISFPATATNPPGLMYNSQP